MYIWQHIEWPAFHWDSGALAEDLAMAHRRQGEILTLLRQLMGEDYQELRGEVLIEESLGTAAIEGERYNPDDVRSSVAGRLGLSRAGLPRHPDARAAGLVEVLLAASEGYRHPLTGRELKEWHRRLFPVTEPVLYDVLPGEWRDDAAGKMQVVYGPIGKEEVLFQAPVAKDIPEEIERFCHWFNNESGAMDGILRAGLAHLWFVVIHPFNDGNGRIARAITERALCRDDGTELRSYSLSSWIMQHRSEYYDILAATTSAASMDVTAWLSWFLQAVKGSIARSISLVDRSLMTHRFWHRYGAVALNERQIKMITRMLGKGTEEFEGGMTTRKYASMNHCSRATAQRELADLRDKGILVAGDSGGRSTSYSLVKI